MTSSLPIRPETQAITATERPTWTGRFRSRAESSFPPEKLLPDRQPSYVASWIYVFGALTLGASASCCSRARCSASRALLVARLSRRPVRELPASVEHRALLLLHGHPPVGQVLHGSLARSPPGDVGHRCPRLYGLDRHGVHRVPLPAELLFRVDQHFGKDGINATAPERSGTS